MAGRIPGTLYFLSFGLSKQVKMTGVKGWGKAVGCRLVLVRGGHCAEHSRGTM